MKNSISRSIALIMALLILFGTGNFTHTVSAYPPISMDYDQIIGTEAAWIASLQLPSGAIPTYSAPLSNYNNKYRIIPYFSNIASMGLLEGPAEYRSNVKKYMDWYFAHLNTSDTDYNGLNGTVYDYDVDADRTTETSRVSYDSTDSYAATFLSLLRRYYEVTGDAQYLIDHQAEIDRIGGAMLGTKVNGLTFAKPDYAIKYLMDNTEVHKGLVDIQWMFNQSDIFNDPGAAAWYGIHLDDITAGIETLWDSTAGIYRQYMDGAGTRGVTTLSNFYPDATAQLFPIWEEILDPSSDRALGLYNKLNENHPGWPILSTPDSFPWAIIAYSAAVMGDKTRVDTFLDAVKTTYMDQSHPWPWYCMEAGMTILAATKAKAIPAITHSLTINTPLNNEVITSIPYEISGTSQGADKIELSLKLNLTQAITIVEVTPSENGSWSYSVPSLLNESYTIKAIAKDKYNNSYNDAAVSVEALLGTSGALLTEVTLTSDLATLRRSESTKLSLTGEVEDGSGESSAANLENATIEYMSNRPDLVIFSTAGDLTLRLMDRSISSISIWANVTLNNVVVQSNHLTINLSTEPLTLYDEILDVEAQSIIEAQLPSGAIPISRTGSTYKIDPRQANIAALGLLERPEYADQVKKYIDWYVSKLFAGMNWPDTNGIYGTAYDYEVEAADPTVEVSLGSYDTAASRIGTFLSLLRKYYDVTGTVAISKYQLDVMTGGIGLATGQQSDGLFWAKPDNKVKRLVDNAEAYQGLKDSVWLFRNVYLDEGAASWFGNFEANVSNGIEANLWDASAGIYKAAIAENGEATVTNRTYAPDAVAELSAIYTGIIEADSPRAASLYQSFNVNHPNWMNLELSDNAPLSYIGYTSALLGDKPRADLFFEAIKSQYIDQGHPTSWSTMQAGVTMLAAQKLQSTVYPVTSLTVSGAGSASTVINGSSLQMNAAVLPVYASNQGITWSVTSGTGTASINSTGLLTASGMGTVSVKAVAQDGSGIESTPYVITIMAQPITPKAPTTLTAQIPIPTPKVEPTAKPEERETTLVDIQAAASNLVNEPDPVKAQSQAIALIQKSSAQIQALQDSGQSTSEMDKALKQLAETVLEKVNIQQVESTVIDHASNTVLTDTMTSQLVDKINTIALTVQELNKALLASHSDEKLQAVLTIQIKPTLGTESAALQNVAIELPASLLTAAAENKLDKIEIKTGISTITIDPSMFEISASDIVTFSANKLQTSVLSEAARAVTGDNQVFDFSLKISGNPKTSFSKAIDIELPYTLAEGNNPDQVTIFYLSDQGVIENVIGRYDPSSKMVKFSTKHFSGYFAKINQVAFTDMNGYGWAQSSIEAMASKEIIKGFGDSRFVPEALITRAQFAALLVRAFKLQDTIATNSFQDVKNTDWFYTEISSAVKAGLIQGRGDGSFAPNDPITRQDMAVILGRVLANEKGKTAVMHNNSYLTRFSDGANIASYASDSVALNVKYRILQGVSDSTFTPDELATRAQAAVVISRLFYLE